MNETKEKPEASDAMDEPMDLQEYQEFKKGQKQRNSKRREKDSLEHIYDEDEIDDDAYSKLKKYIK